MHTHTRRVRDTVIRPDLYVIEGGAEVGARVVRGQVDLRGDALEMNVGVRVDTEAC